MTSRGLATLRDHITEMCLHKYIGSYQSKVQNSSKLNGIGLFSRQVKFAECMTTFNYWNVRTGSAFCERWFASCNWWSNIPHFDTPNSEHTLLMTVLGVSCGYVRLCQDMDTCNAFRCCLITVWQYCESVCVRTRCFWWGFSIYVNLWLTLIQLQNFGRLGVEELI
jgi:hypothetical protein